MSESDPLSPDAQAVLDAMYEVNMDFGDENRALAAATIRAAVDRVLPEQPEPPSGEGEPWPQSYQLMSDFKWEQRQQTRTELLAIIAELEKLNDV